MRWQLRVGRGVDQPWPQDIIPFVQGCLDLFAQDSPILSTRQPSVSH